MNKIIIWIVGIVAVLALILSSVALVGGNQSVPSGILGGITNLDSLTLDEDLVVGGTLTQTGKLTTNAGHLRSYTNATTSVTTGTLSVSDVNGYDVVLLTPTGAAATKTLTFFASSTASTWLPTAGDMQETCFVNGTTTAATTITFAAGTGIDLETASSSPTDLILLAGNTACFKFIRQTATASTFDITAAMIEYTNGD